MSRSGPGLELAARAAVGAALGVFWSVFWSSRVSVADESPVPIGLEEAFSLALRHNKTLVAARLRRAVKEAAIDVARERPNPLLRFETTREVPREALTVGLPLETGGKRGRRVAVAEAAAHSGEAELTRTVADVRVEVRRAYVDLATTQRRVEIAREIEGLVGRAHRAAAERFDAGDASRLEVLQAEVVLLQARNDTETLAGEVAASRSALNALIGREPATPTTVVDEVAGGPPPAAEAATEQALGINATLGVLDRQIAEAEARAALARAEQVPDTEVEGAVTRDALPEFNTGWRAAIGLTVPVFTRHRAGVRLEEAAVSQLRAEREAARERLRGAILGAAARAEAQWKQYQRYRDQILPVEREVEAMAEDSYRTGQTGLVALLQSLQSSREVRSRSVQAAHDYEAALGDLEQVTLAGPK